CGVCSTPRRAPVGSVSLTVKEKLTASVYQEKTKAMPTRKTIQSANAEKASVNAFPPFSFLGAAAAKPMPMRINVQNRKTSMFLHKAINHAAVPSGRRAATLVATGLSMSTVPGGFTQSTSKKIRLLSNPGTKAWEVIASEVP